MTADSATLVVLIDDNPDDLFLARMVIRRASPAVSILEFSDPIAALAYFDNNPAEGRRVVFLDINMPYLDGFEFLEKYEDGKFGRRAADTIFLLTTSLHSEDKARAAAHPLVKRFLSKPMTLELYKDALEAATA